MNQVLNFHSFLFPALLCLSLAMTGCGQKTPAPEPEKAASAPAAAAPAAEKTESPAVENEVAEQSSEAVGLSVKKSGESTVWTSTDEEGKTTTLTVTEKEDGAILEIPAEEGAITMKSGGEAGIPEHFPEDIPVPDTLTVETAMEIGGSTFSLSGTVAQSYDELCAYYREACVAQGWTESAHIAQSGENAITMLNYEKAGRVLAVVIATDEETVRITLSTSFEEDL
ncbi:MAG: hypothetical protein GX130_11520 [Candidatus Hydrogenedens sp.]|jgi:predicted small lipoprotein YifL|nr:hypothetical protein [Candidatus Hydrogenedens sp.]